MDHGGDSGPDGGAAGPAWWTFVAALVVAVPLYVSQARSQWFFGDEWAFLARRDAGSLAGLFDPHQEHWVTTPVIAYRVLWNVVGLHSYKPYLALALAAHLAVVVLLRAVLRQVGVSPWMATTCAVVLLFFGRGSENIVWAFMVTFTGALACGLGQFLLLDRAACSRRRQVAGAGCGIAAVTCSGVGLVALAVVGLALLLRRGVRPALVATLPGLAAYGVWRFTFGTAASSPPASTGAVGRFAAHGLATVVTSATVHVVVAVAVAVVVVVGLALVVGPRPRSWAQVRFDLALPFAATLGAVAFYLLVGRSRAVSFGFDYATRSRFLYVALVLLLPAVAVGADAVARRWRWAGVPVVLLLLAGVPGNIAAIDVVRNRAIPPATVLAVAASVDLAAAPTDLQPWPDLFSLAPISAGWLKAGVDEGQIPDSYEPTPDQAAEATARLALVLEPPRSGLPTDCPVLEDEVRVEVSPRRPLVVSGVTTVRVLGADGGRSAPRDAGTFEPRRITTSGRSLVLVVRPEPAPLPATLCR